MDAGCEFNMYASDITRTFPASGTFSPPQKDLYEAVLNAQKGLIDATTVERKVSLNELQRIGVLPLSPLNYRWRQADSGTACSSLEQELKQIGFHISRGDVQHRLVSSISA